MIQLLLTSPKSIFSFFKIPFMEYPHGSKRKSSIFMLGIILLIPDTWQKQWICMIITFLNLHFLLWCLLEKGSAIRNVNSPRWLLFHLLRFSWKISPLFSDLNPASKFQLFDQAPHLHVRKDIYQVGSRYTNTNSPCRIITSLGKIS